MALPPKYWPNQLPLRPAHESKCGLCHDFSFEAGSVAEGNWKQRRKLKAYYWSWHMYGPHCQFCNVVRETFWNIAESLGYSRYTRLEDFYFMQINLSFRQETVILTVQPPAEPKVLANRWANQQWYLALPQKVGVLPWSYIPEVQYNPGSIQNAAATIMSWLRHCTLEHDSERCRSLYGKFVPTRLVHVDPISHRLRLVESKGIPVQYAALSYCWGGTPQEETKQQNFRQRLQGHELNCLPKLLGDAIELTASCNLEYIWIDAICIVQDDDDDRERELGQMADIYYHAVFTISAAHAHSVQQELVPPERGWIPISNKLATGSSPSSILIKSVAQHDPIGLLLPDETTWPAFDRCWTFQERLISTRVVHFAPDELIWECASIVTCECETIPKVMEWSSLKWGFDHAQGEELREHDFHRLWQTLVTASTQRRLTRESDRLVAIGGLANRFEQQTGGRLGSYLAGIWEKDIKSLYGISWRAGAGSGCRRPQNWMAPSWSWASLKSGIEYPGTNLDLCRFHADVDAVDCVPRSTKNPYGQVRSGELVLTGPHLGVVMDRDSLAEGLIAHMAANGGIADLECEWYWDVPLTDVDREVADRDKVILLLLWSSWPKQSLAPCFTLMILKAHYSQDNTWTRVGVACHGLREGHREATRRLECWMDSLDRGTFRIV